ncbi:hypothetical protein ElyMa_003141300 [Elysia marginata]|uniref:FLYWCH-type domain-containing protein n=1 Tax=Elysia marginata TaxID=1093978 RepID=A0AAV4IV07_9GAST|nr:hypothetical protein ElyMa_003141300 [Elysia marginata]
MPNFGAFISGSIHVVCRMVRWVGVRDWFRSLAPATDRSSFCSAGLTYKGTGACKLEVDHINTTTLNLKPVESGPHQHNNPQPQTIRKWTTSTRQPLTSNQLKVDHINTTTLNLKPVESGSHEHDNPQPQTSGKWTTSTRQPSTSNQLKVDHIQKTTPNFKPIESRSQQKDNPQLQTS